MYIKTIEIWEVLKKKRQFVRILKKTIEFS